MSTKHLRAARLLCVLLSLTLLLAGCGNSNNGTDAEGLELEWGALRRPVNDSQLAPRPNEEPAEPDEPDEPAVVPVEHGDYLWHIETENGSVYMMGTMHILRPEYQLNDIVWDLFNQSDALAVESNVLDEEMMMRTAQLLIYDVAAGETIQDHLSDEGYAYLMDMAQQYGFSIQFLDYIKPYLVSSYFSMIVAEEMGFDTDGVDMKLLNAAVDSGKPILELETADDLYYKLDLLDDDTMERLCILTISEPAKMGEELETLYQAYLSGDDDLMYYYLYEEEDDEAYAHIEFEDKDEMYNYYMITERNEIMADSIASYLETPGQTTFVAAGLAHFIGDDSIVALLEAKGYTVTRMDA